MPDGSFTCGWYHERIPSTNYGHVPVCRRKHSDPDWETHAADQLLHLLDRLEDRLAPIPVRIVLDLRVDPDMSGVALIDMVVAGLAEKGLRPTFAKMELEDEVA